MQRCAFRELGSELRHLSARKRLQEKGTGRPETTGKRVHAGARASKAGRQLRVSPGGTSCFAASLIYSCCLMTEFDGEWRQGAQ